MLEKAALVNTVIFDKTGTLTLGKLSVATATVWAIHEVGKHIVLSLPQSRTRTFCHMSEIEFQKFPKNTKSARCDFWISSHTPTTLT